MYHAFAGVLYGLAELKIEMQRGILLSCWPMGLIIENGRQKTMDRRHFSGKLATICECPRRVAPDFAVPDFAGSDTVNMRRGALANSQTMGGQVAEKQRGEI